MDPNMVPKLVQKLVILWSTVGTLFVEILEPFKCLLGAFLGFSRPTVLNVFANAGFWYFELLMVL